MTGEELPSRPASVFLPSGRVFAADFAARIAFEAGFLRKASAKNHNQVMKNRRIRTSSRKKPVNLIELGGQPDLPLGWGMRRRRKKECNGRVITVEIASAKSIELDGGSTWNYSS